MQGPYSCTTLTVSFIAKKASKNVKKRNGTDVIITNTTNYIVSSSECLVWLCRNFLKYCG